MSIDATVVQMGIAGAGSLHYMGEVPGKVVLSPGAQIPPPFLVTGRWLADSKGPETGSSRPEQNVLGIGSVGTTEENGKARLWNSGSRAYDDRASLNDHYEKECLWR